MKEKEALLGWHFEQLVQEFGYTKGNSIGWAPGRPFAPKARCWWFTRPGQFFITEAVVFQVRWRPTAILSIDLFGSWLTPERLEKQGLDGNAVGNTPFNYQFHQLNIAPSVLLGEEMRLIDDWDTLMIRLREEFYRINPGFWLYLLESHQRLRDKF